LAGLGIAVLSAGACGVMAARAQRAEDSNFFDAQAKSAAVDASRYELRSSIPPKYGNPPAFGAGTSGFDSTNARKKKKQKPNQKQNPKSAIEAKALPPLPVRPVDTTLAAVYQQQPNAASRYARRGAGALTPDASAIALRPPVRRKAEEDPYDQLGIRAGAFILRPAIEISGGHDSNPGRIHDGAGSSFIQNTGELKLKSDWVRHEVSAQMRGGYIWYQELPNLNKPDFDGKANARIDVTSHTRVNVEGRYSRYVDSPGDPNLPSGIAKPPVITSAGASAGLTQEFNRLELAFKALADRNEYSDATLNDGTIFSQKDRNYNQYAAQLRASYELLPGVKPFVEGRLDRRVHDLEIDSAGIMRDSEGRTVKAGSTFELSKKLIGEVAIGYLTRNYEDPSLQETRAPLLDASLIYFATALTTATLTAKTGVDESTISGVSGIIRRDAALQIDHSFRRWLIGSLKFAYGRDTYQGDMRQDQRYAASAGLVYKLTRSMQLKGEYRQEWLRSNLSGNDLTAKVGLVGLRWQP
jgi:hypothetical protein